MGNLIKILVENSKSQTHELITEFLDSYKLCGMREAKEEQLQEFINKKGL